MCKILIYLPVQDICKMRTVNKESKESGFDALVAKATFKEDLSVDPISSNPLLNEIRGKVRQVKFIVREDDFEGIFESYISAFLAMRSMHLDFLVQSFNWPPTITLPKIQLCVLDISLTKFKLNFVKSLLTSLLNLAVLKFGRYL